MKKFLGIICLLYSLIIIYIWISNKLDNYLAPTMQMYLKISLIPLIIMGLVLCFNSKFNYKFKTIDLILLLPVLMLILSGDGVLSMNFANNRMTTFASKQNMSNGLKKDNSKNDEEDAKSNKTVEEQIINSIDIDVTNEGYISLADYLTFESKATKFKGNTIKIKGFTILNENYIPDGYFAIGKYGISCCAADAEFSGFIAKYDKSKLKDKTWYEIEGILEPMSDNNYGMVLYINVINIKEIDPKNEETYVYPCYSYDDGTCSFLDNYNLEY